MLDVGRIRRRTLIAQQELASHLWMSHVASAVRISKAYTPASALLPALLSLMKSRRTTYQAGIMNSGEVFVDGGNELALVP